MSVANLVPETYGTTDGDDARKTLATTGRGRLIKDAFQRLRAADGFSHARSLAFLTALVLVQGVIALVGLATVLGKGGMSDAIVNSLQTAAPGPAGKILTEAVAQAHKSGTHQSLALILGAATAIITGTTLMGQLERGLNRIYGIEQDRPTLQKYGRAFVLAISAGALATAAFFAIALGRSVGDSFGSDTAATAWNVLRWPLGVALMIGATALLFKWSPRRHQPAWSWLAFGAMVAVGLSFVASLLLAWYFSASSSFGQTYGPLAGLIALLLWSLFSSIALLYGGAIGAQLEAVRAGRPEPKDLGKVAGAASASGPSSAPPVRTADLVDGDRTSAAR
jgi:YihY family inner membrane protein